MDAADLDLAVTAQSNVGDILPPDAVASALTASASRAEAGYDLEGRPGGPFTKESPPPGLVFSGYQKGCTGIVWMPAPSPASAPQQKN